jgi:hypothetical protein
VGAGNGTGVRILRRVNEHVFDEPDADRVIAW